MIDQFRTVYRGGTGEIVEKKSRFIATVRLVESEEEALSCLEALRKKYWDARHNCFVYIIGENQETVRCSDRAADARCGTGSRPPQCACCGDAVFRRYAAGNGRPGARVLAGGAGGAGKQCSD